MGRRSTYDPEKHLPFVKLLAEKGCTDREIYPALGIGEKTFYEWKNRHPQFAQTIEKAREKPLVAVEGALYRRCMGYEYSETTLERNEVGEMVATKIVQKQMAPNLTGIIFYLINRSDRWHDTRSAQKELGADEIRGLIDAMALTAEEMAQADADVQKYRPVAIEDMKDVSPGNNGGNGNGNGE